MEDGSESSWHCEIAAQSIQMLRTVVDGATYEAVAQRFGISRTAVERRVKSIAVRLTQEVGVEGLRAEGTGSVRRLRSRRDEVLAALERFSPIAPSGDRPARVLSEAEVARGALRIKGRAARTWHDLALYRLLFATGLRPLEVARLEVRDYVGVDGSVCRKSELREEAAINGKARPLFFVNSRLDEVLGAYLEERLTKGHGVGVPGRYRGLDPGGRLFLGPSGEPYKITASGEAGQRRHLCRALLEIYRKLFRYADIDGLSTQSARLTLMSRMYARGADEDQVGVILGIADRSAVREQLPRPKPTLAELLDEVV
jgi:integrase